MKTDSIFYRLFQEFPGIFFELIGNSSPTLEAYKFSSIEIKQTAFRIDGVFLPTQSEQNPIYFVEVQFQTDTEIYSHLFSEIFLYLHQNKPNNPWRGVVIYPTRSLDTADINNYNEFFTSQRVSRIYLEELGETASLPIGIATIKLIVENENTVITVARLLIDRTQQEITTDLQQRQLLELIETILVYKFPTMSRKEIESMFGLSDLKQTRVYQEGKEEGARQEKLRMIPLLLRLGLSFEEISKEIDLSLEEVQQAMQK
ncbi:Rpn family recombination-promoting nuclease/putative transposase [Nostocaceae cyanobacterium CENA357]|uniref:Rpn family recombination-promoting nuclease/putative transposase n=1 Tax=Atlanticothrix silvestris CENA357 TaxID=1725252 RepID=A0A8J7L3W3_9CYAN|nr:Rpn family recombination-promoting nuclease/putative transposase [Atlanticothrix silvestris]MBH8554171.1 Rpn family recombination-promoting nuclease/putative transposase [Atlanticothrix silvestris CENA357]